MSKRTRKHNRNIGDTAMGELLEAISYRAKWYGRELTVVGDFFPSTKACSCCGFVIDKLPTKIRSWKCPKCGTEHDRDTNAAVNIRNEGLKLRSSK